MQRKVLVAGVAAAPLLMLAQAAWAQTQITNARTTPVVTSTVNNGAADDVNITSAASITLTAPGAAVTRDSNNAVTQAGTITAKDVSDFTGVLLKGGTSGALNNTGAISITETYTPTDADKDGDLDGAFAQGNNRFGIRAVGPGAISGNVVNSGAITINGNDSAGISLETQLNGDLTQSGSITVVGARGYGVHTQNVTGAVKILGGASVNGEGSVGVAVDGDVGGIVKIQSSIFASGYRYNVRDLNLAQLGVDQTKLDADDLLQGGPAVRITGSVAGGILFDIAPTTLDTTKPDSDNDGVADTAEGNASITVLGSAPAVLVGSDSQTINVGAVGTGDDAYGMILRGSITASGLFDNKSAIGVQIGGANGHATNIAGGVRTSAAISASAYSADATGFLFKAGANAPTLWNQDEIGAGIIGDGQYTATAVQIDAGAVVNRVINNDAIRAGVQGGSGSAYAVRDLSGTLNYIENTGAISAAVTALDDEAVTGKNVAIDASANTSGVTLLQQSASTTSTTVPSIFGAILLGSGDDVVDVRSGAVQGDISFGAGADRLSISGGAAVAGAVTDTDGRLVIDVAKGSLAVTNTAAINATSLNVGAQSTLIVAVDPKNSQNTRLNVGQASFGDGAKVGVVLKSLLNGPQRFTIVQAGSLSAGALGQVDQSTVPYLFLSQAGADLGAGQIYVDVRRRTASELGFNRSEAQAYDAVYEALRTNDGLADVVLRQTGQRGLREVYDRFLPDQLGATFDALTYADQAISQAIGQRPDRTERYGPDSFWVHEINTLVRRERSDMLGTDAQTFGFVGGYESMSDSGGALGATLAYMNIEEHDEAAQVGEQTTTSFVQAGLYWRQAFGGLLVNARAAAGYGWFDSDRTFIDVDSDLDLANSASWGGFSASAHLGASYEQRFGRYFLRPEGSLDYFYLNEADRAEKGGAAGFDLTVDERTSKQFSGEAAMAFGAQFGREVWVRPEVRVGYRQVISGQLGDTIARFAGGQAFTLSGQDGDKGAATLNLALRAGTGMSYVALEGGAEARKKSTRYNVRLSGRVMF